MPSSVFPKFQERKIKKKRKGLFEEAQHHICLVYYGEKESLETGEEKEQELKTKLTKEPTKNRHILKLLNTCHYISARNGFQISFWYILRVFKNFRKNGQCLMFVGDNFKILLLMPLPRQRAVHLNIPFIAGERKEDDFLLNWLRNAIIFLFHFLEGLIFGHNPGRDIQQGVGCTFS